MLRRLRDFLVGKRTVTIPKDEACCAFDLIYRNGLRFHGERRLLDGSIRITMSDRDARVFSRLSGARDMSCTVSRPSGMPVVLDYIKRRPMIPVGLVMILAWMLYSERIVWDVRVSGNTKTPTEEIVRRLDDLGFGVGTYYPAVNFNQLHADYAASQSDIAWLSVYMNGTVAEVEVRELSKGEKFEKAGNVYANVVAAEAGVVREINVIEGQAAVRIGDIVSPGQVLISGVVEMKEENAVRYEYASGEVICTCPTPIDISSAVKRTEKTYTGGKKTEKTVKIFKKNVNLFVNGGKEVPSCDKIETVKQVTLFHRLKLPVWIKSVTYRKYTETEITHSADEVVNEVMSRLSDEMKRLSERGTMVGKELDAKYENGVYRISGVVYFDRDIGKTEEFTAEK